MRKQIFLSCGMSKCREWGYKYKIGDTELSLLQTEIEYSHWLSLFAGICCKNYLFCNISQNSFGFVGSLGKRGRTPETNQNNTAVYFSLLKKTTF